MKAFIFTLAVFFWSAVLPVPARLHRGLSDSRMVGGTDAAVGESLYTTGIRFTKDGINFCGGSLIAPKLVLTAAHCVVINGTTPELFVSVGSNLNQGTFDGQQIQVKRTVVHPRYNNETFRFDFAILILRKPALAKYKPVCLAAASGRDEKVGSEATVRGWGTTKEGGGAESLSGFKLEVTMPIISNPKCHKVYKEAVKITPEMICAGGFTGKSACHGDSGGPLVVKHADGSERLVGVVSFGAGCAQPGIPIVYGRVSKSLPFIQKFMQKYSTTEQHSSENPNTVAAEDKEPTDDDADAIEEEKKALMQKPLNLTSRQRILN